MNCWHLCGGRYVLAVALFLCTPAFQVFPSFQGSGPAHQLTCACACACRWPRLPALLQQERADQQ